MIVIGELINGTRKRIKRAIAERDEAHIASLAQKQAAAGADFIDCNPGTIGDDEINDIRWLVTTVQGATDLPISFDTPNTSAVEAAFGVYKNDATPMINSITAEHERLEGMLDFTVASNANVVALALSDAGMPTSADDRVQTAVGLIDTLTGAGIAAESIFVDPVIAPLGTDPQTACAVLEAIRRIKAERPNVHITCGLSNISFGLPERALLNRVFIAQAIAAGLDSAITDPLDRDIMATIYAAEALAGRDEWCMNYITASREEKLSTSN